MRILCVPIAPDAYRVTVRDDAGTLLMRATGPASFCLEQLAQAWPTAGASPVPALLPAATDGTALEDWTS